jgi:hypothetical protein
MSQLFNIRGCNTGKVFRFPALKSSAALIASGRVERRVNVFAMGIEATVVSHPELIFHDTPPQGRFRRKNLLKPDQFRY